MIQEYRKASAEALVIDMFCDICSGQKNNIGECDKCGDCSDEIHFYHDKIGSNQRYVTDVWHPDKDANQMLMVWEWLRENVPNGIMLHGILVSVLNQFRDGGDIKLTTMKCFMQYIKTTQNND